MTRQEKFKKIVRYKHGNPPNNNFTWLVTKDSDVSIILNCVNFIYFIKKDLPQKPFNIIEKLILSKNYNNHLLAIELIYSELLKNNKLPK